MQINSEDMLEAFRTAGIFALLLGADLAASDMDEMVAAFHHMGLQPEVMPDLGVAPTDTDQAGDALFLAPAIRLHFGQLTVVAGWSSPQAISMADPLAPLCSSVAGPFPAQWQAGRQCLTVIPLLVAKPGSTGSTDHTKMRDFFKMIVLLIDLFGASHLYWSPARLWSDAEQMRTAITEMTISGILPVPHLVTFRLQECEAGSRMVTRGLSYFVAQELMANVPAGWSSARVIKQLARISLDMMINGPVTGPRRNKGPEGDEWVFISPPEPEEAEQDGMVRVEFISQFNAPLLRKYMSGVKA
jgi:hypothetical protein